MSEAIKCPKCRNHWLDDALAPMCRFCKALVTTRAKRVHARHCVACHDSLVAALRDMLSYGSSAPATIRDQAVSALAKADAMLAERKK